jgi:hypothetical protein
LRGQTTASSKSILSGVTSSQEGVEALIARAQQILNQRENDNFPLARRDNTIGVILLALSLALFSIALILQIEIEPSFHQKKPVKTSDSFPITMTA